MLQIFDIGPQHKFKKGPAIGKFKNLGEKELFCDLYFILFKSMANAKVWSVDDLCNLFS
jgi:hypothetical protein